MTETTVFPSPQIKQTLQEDILSALAGSSGAGGSNNTPEPADTLQNRATHAHMQEAGGGLTGFYTHHID